jgi:dTDP-4-dehydrorhamnose reductase
MGFDRPILVVGKAGQVARCLVDAGQLKGLPVLAAGRPQLDITDPQSVDRKIAAVLPRAIVNAAAYTAVDKAETEVAQAFALNRDGAGNLADAARKLCVPFIHISTDYVFDGRKPTPYQEDDLPSPLSVYGRSKLEGELAVLEANPDALIVRTAWVYSPYGSNFVKTMLRLAETQDVVRVVDDQCGAPTDAMEIARALLDMTMRLIESGMQRRSGIYHLTAFGETTWYGFAAAVYDEWASRGRRVPLLQAIATADYPTPAPRPANSRLDCTKIERTFGVRLPFWSMPLGGCVAHLAEARS